MRRISDKTILFKKIKQQGKARKHEISLPGSQHVRNVSGLKRHSVKKRIAGGAAAGTVAAGILLSGLFGSPAELTQHNEQMLKNRPVVQQMVDLDIEEEESQDDSELAGVKKKKSLLTKVKEKILNLPMIVRALVGVPLWAVGWGIVTGLDLLWGAASPVILPVIIKLLLLLLVIFAIVFLVIKAIHPDLPAKEIIKKIFKKRNLSSIIIAAVVLTAADTVLLLVWKDYDPWRRLVIFVAGLVLLFLILWPFLRRKMRPAVS